MSFSLWQFNISPAFQHRRKLTMAWYDELATWYNRVNKPDVSLQISQAYTEDNLDEFARLLNENPSELLTEDGLDHWMWTSAMEGKLSFVKALVELGIDINHPSSHDRPEGAIAEAAAHNHLEIVQWMLDNGAEMNFEVEGQLCSLALFGAVQGGHLEVVKLLVDHGADIHANWDGLNMVADADDNGFYDIRDYLISQGATHICETIPPNYAAAHQQLIEEITYDGDHVEENRPLGEWKSFVPGQPDVKLHSVPARNDWEELLIFTTGLSDRNIPVDEDQMYSGIELLMILPTDWEFSEEALLEPRWNWPLECMKLLINQIRSLDFLPPHPILLTNDELSDYCPANNLSGWFLQRYDEIRCADSRNVNIYKITPVSTQDVEAIQKEGEQEYFDIVFKIEKKNSARIFYDFS